MHVGVIDFVEPDENSAKYKKEAFDITLEDVENLKVILSGPKSPNASELILDSMMEQIINELKEHFDYIISNPPFGREWKNEKKKIEEEAKLGFGGRFGAGLPAVGDGQMLFLETAIAKMKPP